VIPRAKPKPNAGVALRFNAPRHGLTSSAPVIPGVESVEECQAHREALSQLEAAQSRRAGAPTPFHQAYGLPGG
jgi:hypothetical protein